MKIKKLQCRRHNAMLSSLTGKAKIFITLNLLMLYSIFRAQNTTTLTGRIFNSENKEILPFAAIYNADGHSISNEDGVFELKLNKPAKWIKVRYTGFQEDSIVLDQRLNYLDVYLKPLPNLINEVVITAKSGNFRYKLFFKAVESYFKTGIKESSCKSYYRTYTLLNGSKPAELFESFHNTTCNAQEIKNLKLKGGRFLLPRNKTFINLASTVFLEMFKPCENAQNLFPFSPLQCSTVLQLKNTYTILIKNIIKTADDTLYHFIFNAIDTVNSFSGELFYYKRQERVDKIRFHATSITNPPLYSMRDPEKDKISRLKYVIEIGYSVHKNKNLISYINFDMNFNLKTAGQIDFVQTNMKVVNFEYEKSFFLPIYPEKVDFKFDYEKVAAFPYNASLFENNVFIKESANEILIRKMFDSIRCYNSITLDESVLFLPKRFERWTATWLLDDDLLKEDYVPEAHIQYGNNYSKSKKAQWDSIFAFTFIFLDYECSINYPVFSLNGVLDYKYSFLRYKSETKNDSINRDYIRLFLENCQDICKEFKKFLDKKYQNRCPLEEELREDYKKFVKMNVAETYLIHAAANSPGKEQAYFILKDRLVNNRKRMIK